MEKYKPGYMGKVIPADDPSKMTDFCNNQYDAFSKIYDACKDHSDDIKDIKAVDSSDSNSLSVKILATEDDTMEKIKSESTDESVTIEGDTITAKS